MAKLLLRVCEAEGLIDFIALALVADQGADIPSACASCR